MKKQRFPDREFLVGTELAQTDVVHEVDGTSVKVGPSVVHPASKPELVRLAVALRNAGRLFCQGNPELEDVFICCAQPDFATFMWGF